MTAREPLTTPDVDLRDFAFMPLDVVRLRDSDLVAQASDAGFRAAVLLWCAAWHQIPAASLPDDERALAHLSGFGRDLKGWRSVRDEALRGFEKCDDGRLYHTTLAEHALRVWKKKVARQGRIIRRLEIESGYWDSVRLSAFKRDKFTCQYCGAIGVRLECDHVIPVSRGGKSDLGNLLTACRSCNRSKGSKLISEWLQ